MTTASAVLSIKRSLSSGGYRPSAFALSRLTTDDSSCRLAVSHLRLAARKPRLEPPRQIRNRQTHDQIDRRRQQKDLHWQEAGGGQIARPEHQLRRRDDRGHRGVLQERDAEVRQRRQHYPQRLWQDDPTHGRQR